MTKKILIITANQIRHDYLRYIFGQSNDIEVLRSYVESVSAPDSQTQLEELEVNHFLARTKTEEDFFLGTLNLIDDLSNPYQIEKGEINKPEYIDELSQLKFDFIVTFGCCILKKNFLKEFERKIINVHLGISPYYLGAGTNFHSLVNGDFQCTGYTFMFMDEGIDTGEIIHQGRAKVYPFDNPHQIGNRVIKDMVHDFVKLITNFKLVKPVQISYPSYDPIVCKIKDASFEKTLKLYKNFEQGAVLDYISKREEITKQFPIVQQKFMSL